MHAGKKTGFIPLKVNKSFVVLWVVKYWICVGAVCSKYKVRIGKPKGTV